MSIGAKIKQMHQDFYDFWLSYRLSSGLVPQKEVQPHRLKSILPNIVKIKGFGEDARFTLVGTNVVEEYERDFTGLKVKDHPYDVCRETYLSMIERLNAGQGLVNCHGIFCYLNKHYLRTMESGFGLACPETGEITGYLVLVTVDHSNYMEKLYLPMMPEQVDCKESVIANQTDFETTMHTYQSMMFPDPTLSPVADPLPRGSV